MEPPTGLAYDYLLIVDFEATCDEGEAPVVTRDNQEIIEFPWLVFDLKTTSVIDTNRLYVKPQYISSLPKFCTQLTGITDAMLENAVPLVDAVRQFDEYIGANITAKGKSFCILTDGGWDLKQALMRECKKKDIILAPHYFRFFDLKVAFQVCMKIGRQLSLRGMAMALGTPVEKQHSGLSDCNTIAHIVKALLAKGHRFTTPESIPVTYDPDADLASFPAFNTSGNPSHREAAVNPPVPAPPTPATHNLTYTPPPPALAPPPPPPAAVYMHALPPTMPVAYSPVAHALPTSIRPGDWMCPKCNDHNFASRPMCRKCGTPNPSGVDVSRPEPPMKQGDWRCPQCRGLNFASRESCYTCRAPRFAYGNAGYTSQRAAGDWSCRCGELNFSFRAQCRQCGAPAATYDRNAREAHRGRPGDWLCSGCNELNFASRQACRRCEASRATAASVIGF